MKDEPTWSMLYTAKEVMDGTHRRVCVPNLCEAIVVNGNVVLLV